MTAVDSAAAATARPTRPYFDRINGLRALAALAVFFHHIGFQTGATFNTRIGNFLGRLDVGVPIFFAISGFLLFRPHVVALFDETEFGDLKTLYRKRFFRIYPAYWVVLGSIALTVGLRAKAQDTVLHVLLLQIYKGEAFLDGMSQSWSLAVEVSFYLLLPLFARFLRRATEFQHVSERAIAIGGYLALLIAGSVVWRVFVYGVGLDDRAVFWLPGTIDYFAIGMGLATVSAWAERSDVGRQIADALGRNDLVWWLSGLAILVFVSYQLELELGLDRAAWHKELFRQAGYGAVTLCALVPATFGDSSGVVRRLLAWKPLAWLGTISYSFYLWHLVVIEKWIEWRDHATSLGFLDWATETLLGATMAEITIGSFIVTTILAAVTYRLVEKPTQQWSRSKASS